MLKSLCFLFRIIVPAAPFLPLPSPLHQQRHSYHSPHLFINSTIPTTPLTSFSTAPLIPLPSSLHQQHHSYHSLHFFLNSSTHTTPLTSSSTQFPWQELYRAASFLELHWSLWARTRLGSLLSLIILIRGSGMRGNVQNRVEIRKECCGDNKTLIMGIMGRCCGNITGVVRIGGYYECFSIYLKILLHPVDMQ